jgi:hypothetical protein
MLFDPNVVVAQALITSLFDGPGILPTMLTVASYTSVATQFHAAAAGVDGSMLLMNESWRSPSADKAQGAFRVYSSWLREQGDVAHRTAAALTQGAEAYTTAQQGMSAVQAWLTEFELRQNALASTPHTFPIMLALESESFAILGAAVGVMGIYEGNLSKAIAAFPEPTIAQPIVNNSGALGVPNGYSDPTSDLLNSGLSPIHSAISGSSSSNPGSTVQQSAGESGQSADPVSQAGSTSPTDPQTGTPDLSSQTPAMDSETNEYGNNSLDSTENQSIDTNSGYTAGYAGFGAGMGGYAVLGMTRGGLGTMSGSATGFRLPANWASRATRSFGAAEVEAEAEPVLRQGTAPKGATAPEAQMRRRKEEKVRSGKVIVPGEDLEVPELESGNLEIGVLGYVEEFADEPITDDSLTIGVIDRVDGEAALHSVSGDIRRG